jgi:hypothetical protein
MHSKVPIPLQSKGCTNQRGLTHGANAIRNTDGVHCMGGIRPENAPTAASTLNTLPRDHAASRHERSLALPFLFFPCRAKELALARQSRPEQQEQAESQRRPEQQAESQSRPASNWSARCDGCMQWFEVEQAPARSDVWKRSQIGKITPKKRN